MEVSGKFNWNGYLALPILESLQRRGFFDLLGKGRPVSITVLARNLQAQPRCLAIALGFLCELGIIKEKNGKYSNGIIVNETLLVASNLLGIWRNKPVNISELLTIFEKGLTQVEKIGSAEPEKFLNCVLRNYHVALTLLTFHRLAKSGNLESGYGNLTTERVVTLKRLGLFLGMQQKFSSVPEALSSILKMEDLLFFRKYENFIENIESTLFPEQSGTDVVDDWSVSEIIDKELKSSYFHDDSPISLLNRLLKNITTESILILSKKENRRIGCYYSVLQKNGVARDLGEIIYEYDEAKKNTKLALDGKDICLQVYCDIKRSVKINGAKKYSRDISALVRHGKNIYFNNRGYSVDQERVLHAWREVFDTLAKEATPAGLILRTVHHIHTKNEHTHALVAALHLAEKNLITAEETIVLAAQAGLFCSDIVKKFPRTSTYTCSILAHFEKRDYCIRHARLDDLDKLCLLEAQCWAPGIATPRQGIQRRIKNYPQGQFVVVIKNEVVGVIYSQRIENIESVAKHNSNNVYKLHKENGSIVQLLAVNIAPEFQDISLGDQLLEFMLQRSALAEGVDTVIGVTLCKSYYKASSGKFEDYIKEKNQIGHLVDPILFFHQSHGAEIVGAVPNYRENDLDNQGNGVLVHYDILNRKVINKAQLVQSKAVEDNTVLDITCFEEECRNFIEKEISSYLSTENRNAFQFDRPLMEMGLDSADFLEMQGKLSGKFRIKIDATFFFRFNTVDKIVQYIVSTYNMEKHPTPAGREKQGAIKREAHTSVTGVEAAKRQRLGNTGQGNSNDIAVVGMSCRLPGSINNLESLWQLLIEKKTAIDICPEGRIPWENHVPQWHSMEGLIKGGYISDVDKFDAAFFRLPPKEVICMDPQQRILLEMAWECIENAAITPEKLSCRTTGVFVGASSSDYSRLLSEAGVEVEAHHATGCAMSVLANRISYYFDLQGPSVQIDTACSSSLVAVHQAIRSIRNGECRQAFAGGINLILHPATSLAYYKAGMLSRDGQCFSFDERANGYVRSEGAGLILLKSLSDAVADGDIIFAVIKGSSSAHGGLAAGLTVPNSQAQCRLIVDAWKDAGVGGEQISYIEAHGTGTPLGDPIEIRGIAEAFAQGCPGKSSLAVSVGSVKSNLGHLEAAAGIAGLLKIILALKYKMLPPSATFEHANPKIDIENTPVRVVRHIEQWQQSTPRSAGVSSFGSGGTNAHVVVQEYVGATHMRRSSNSEQVFVLSAKSIGALVEYLKRMQEYLVEHESTLNLVDIAHTLQVGRQPMDFRIALVAGNTTDLIEKLKCVTNLLMPEAGSPSVELADYQRTVAGIFEHLKGESEQQNEKASSWLKGADVIWNEEASQSGKRISLPGYPFEKSRYWIGADTENSEVKVACQAATVLGEKLSYGKENLVFVKQWKVIPEILLFSQGDFRCFSLGFTIELIVRAAIEYPNQNTPVIIEQFKFYPFEFNADTVVYETAVSHYERQLKVEVSLRENENLFTVAEAVINRQADAIISAPALVTSLVELNAILRHGGIKSAFPIAAIDCLFPIMARELGDCLSIENISVNQLMQQDDIVTTSSGSRNFVLHGRNHGLLMTIRY